MFKTLLRPLRWLPILIVLAAFVVYVWPTLYRYDHISFDNSVYPVRINRLNGNSDMLLPDEGWVPVEGEQGPGAEQNVSRRGRRGV
jgi:hypothetical protein